MELAGSHPVRTDREVTTMPKISVRHRSTLPAIVALVASLQLGCFAYGKTGRDIDRYCGSCKLH